MAATVKSDNINAAKGNILKVTDEGVTPQELMETYRTWAKDYDHDNFVTLGSAGPEYLTEELKSYITDKDAKIFDIACGSGAVGIKLVEKGFHNIDGLDPSQEMIDIARSTNAYKRILKEFIGPDPTPGIDSNFYDGAIVCGGFAINHLKASCIQEILRMIKPGSYFVSHSTKRYTESKFLNDLWDVIDELCQQKECELIKKTDFRLMHERDDTMFVLRKL